MFGGVGRQPSGIKGSLWAARDGRGEQQIQGDVGGRLQLAYKESSDRAAQDRDGQKPVPPETPGCLSVRPYRSVQPSARPPVRPSSPVRPAVQPSGPVRTRPDPSDPSRPVRPVWPSAMPVQHLAGACLAHRQQTAPYTTQQHHREK